MYTISVIIPVYNEEKTIDKTLQDIRGHGPLEIIVADGGSFDETLQIAHRHPVKVVHARKNRAFQMNAGARAASGDIFLFLHADSSLEKGSLKSIRGCANRGFIGGSLTQKIDSSRQVYRFIEKSGSIRANFFKIFYGDQAIFVRRDKFFQVGGFDDVDLLDDAMFSRKLKRAGKTCVLKERVYTSARRWENQGIAKATIINWLISVGFLLGIAPSQLKKMYKDIR